MSVTFARWREYGHPCSIRVLAVYQDAAGLDTVVIDFNCVVRFDWQCAMAIGLQIGSAERFDRRRLNAAKLFDEHFGVALEIV